MADGDVVFGVDTSQWPRAAKVIQSEASRIGQLLQQLNGATTRSGGVAPNAKGPFKELLREAEQAARILPQYYARVQKGLTAAGPGGPFDMSRVKGVNAKQAVEQTLNAYQGALSNFGRRLGQLGVPQNIANQLMGTLSQAFTSEVGRLEQVLYRNIDTLAGKGRARVKGVGQLLGGAIKDEAGRAAPRFPVDVPGTANRSYVRAASAYSAGRAANQAELARQAAGPTQFPPAFGGLNPQAVRNAQEVARAAGQVRQAITDIGRAPALNEVFSRRAVVNARDLAAASRVLKDVVYPAVPGSRGGIPRTAPELRRNADRILSTPPPFAATYSDAVLQRRAFAQTRLNAPQNIPPAVLNTAFRGFGDTVARQIAQAAEAAQRRVEQAARQAERGPRVGRVTPDERAAQVAGVAAQRQFREQTLARLEAESQARVAARQAQIDAVKARIEPFGTILGRTAPPPRPNDEQLEALTAAKARDTAATQRLTAAEQALAAARTAGQGPAQLRQIAAAQARLGELNAIPAAERTPKQNARLAATQARLAELQGAPAKSPEISAAERQYASATRAVAKARGDLAAAQAPVADHEQFQREMNNARRALADIATARTGPAMGLLTSAAQERVNSLNAESRLSRASIQARASEPLQAFYAGGGRGGIGGFGGVPPGGGGGPLSPGEAFLGGLTSRGFNSGGGFQANLTGLAGTAGTLIKYGVLSTAIYGIAGAFGSAKTEILDYVDSLTDLSTALDDGTLDFADLRSEIDHNVVPSLQNISRLTGANVGESLDAMTRGIRAFTDSSQGQPERQRVGIRTAEVANQLAVITGGDVKDKSGDLIAIGSAFGFAGDQLDQITDAIAHAKSMGGDLNQISQGLANFAQVAGTAGVNVQEAANLISVVQARTDQSGQAVATRLGRISQIIGTAGNQDVLKRYNVDTTGGFLEQLSTLNKGLDQAPAGERKAVISRLGGTANVREFTVALREADAIIAKSADDMRKAGAGADLFGRKTADLAGLFRKISGDVKNIFVNLNRADIGKPLGVGLIVMEQMLKTVNELIGVFGILDDRITSIGFAVLQVVAAMKLWNALQARRALNTPIPVGGVAATALEGKGAYVLGTPQAAAAARRPAGRIPVHPGVAAEVVAVRGLAAAEISAAQAQAARATVTKTLAAADLKSAEAALAAAEAEKVRQGAMLIGVATTEEKIALDTAMAAAVNRVTVAQLELAVATQEIAAAEVTEAETTAALTLQLNRLTAANEALAVSQGAVAGTGRASMAGMLWGARRSTGGGAAGAGAPGLWGSSGPLGKALIAGTIAYIGVAVTRGISDGFAKVATARGDAGRAYGALNSAEDFTGTEKAIQGLREAGDKYKAASEGFFGSIIDEVGQVFGADSLGGRGQDLIEAADREDKNLEARKKAQRELASQGKEEVFQDFTLEGIKGAFEKLEAAGTGAATSIELVSKAFAGLGQNLPQGTILPKKLDGLSAGLAGLFSDPFGTPLKSALAGVYQQTGDQPSPYKARGAGELVGGILRDITPFIGDAGDDKAAARAKGKLDPKKIAKREAELIKDELGLKDYRAEIQQAREEVAGHELASLFRDENKTKKLGESTRSLLTGYFEDKGISEEAGGFLSDADQQELAQKLADNTAAAIGLTGEEGRLLIEKLRAGYVTALQEGLDPEKLIVGDQATSSTVAQFLLGKANALPGQLQFGDAGALKAARAAEKAASDSLATARGGQVDALNAQIVQAQADQAAAYAAVDPVTAGRRRLAEILKAEQLQIRSNTAVDESLIQSELEARRDLADSIEEGLEAHLANVGFSTDPAKQAQTNLKIAKQKLEYYKKLKAGKFDELGADLAPEDIAKAVGITSPTTTGKDAAGKVIDGFSAANFAGAGQVAGQAAASGFLAGAGLALDDLGPIPVGGISGDDPQARTIPGQDGAPPATTGSSISLDGDAGNGFTLDPKAAAAANKNKKSVKDTAGKIFDPIQEGLELGIKQAQAAVDDDNGAADKALALAQAKILAGVDPRSALSAARAQLAAAQLALAHYATDDPEYWQALAQVNQLKLTIAQELAAQASAARAAGRFPGDTLGAARDAITDARAQLNLTTVGTKEYYAAQAALRSAQVALAEEQRNAAKTHFLLTHDNTDPVIQAVAETRAARAKLRSDRAKGAPKNVLEADELAVKNAEQAEQESRFRKRFDAAQVAERLGRISHAQYMKYLSNEHDRLVAIKDRTYQQQKDLDDVDSAIKTAQDALSGQFNIGDIKLPTAYEIRRFIKAQGSVQGQYAQGATQNVTINISGGNQAQVESTLAKYFGPLATQSVSTAPRK